MDLRPVSADGTFVGGRMSAAHAVDPHRRRSRLDSERTATWAMRVARMTGSRVGEADRVRAREMFEALAACPDDTGQRGQLREELIRMHLPLVRFLARRYANRGEPMDDLL